jgi:hypothetical protein
VLVHTRRLQNSSSRLASAGKSRRGVGVWDGGGCVEAAYLCPQLGSLNPDQTGACQLGWLSVEEHCWRVTVADAFGEGCGHAWEWLEERRWGVGREVSDITGRWD